MTQESAAAIVVGRPSPNSDTVLLNGGLNNISESVVALDTELSRLFNLSTELVSISRLDGEIQMINPAWSRTLGYTEQEILSGPITRFVHPYDVEPMLRVGDLLAASPGISRSFENRWRCKDGAYRWLSWNAVFVREQDRIYGVARDVTDAKAAEEAQRESEQRLAAVIAQMPAGIILAEAPGGRKIFSNQEIDRIVGRPIRKISRNEDYCVPNLHNMDNSPVAREDDPLARHPIWRGDAPEGGNNGASGRDKPVLYD